MLLNKLYTLRKKEYTEGRWNYTVELDPAHAVFKGHFPDNPIVPGVCSLQIIRECAEDILGHKVRMPQLSSCKFLAMVKPDDNRHLTLSLCISDPSDSGEMSLQAEGHNGDQSFIKIKATLAKIPE